MQILIAVRKLNIHGYSEGELLVMKEKVSVSFEQLNTLQKKRNQNRRSNHKLPLALKYSKNQTFRR